MKKMMFLSKICYFSVQKALIYYTFNKSHHNSFILLVFSHVANFRYVANFRFLTLHTTGGKIHGYKHWAKRHYPCVRCCDTFENAQYLNLHYVTVLH